MEQTSQRLDYAVHTEARASCCGDEWEDERHHWAGGAAGVAHVQPGVDRGALARRALYGALLDRQRQDRDGGGQHRRALRAAGGVGTILKRISQEVMIMVEEEDYVDISVLGSVYREQMTVTGPTRYRHKRIYPVEMESKHWTHGRRPDLPLKPELEVPK